MDKSNKSRDEGAELTKLTLMWARKHVTGDNKEKGAKTSISVRCRKKNTEFEKTQFDRVLSLKESMPLKPWIFIATIKRYLEITNGEVNCRELRTFVLPDP